ncbi:MAG: hypothetical protein JO301_17255 [Chitinophagaceae bacterium]|nr:hypothetical protein [Chitinophagaceae bacterium]
MIHKPLQLPVSLTGIALFLVLVFAIIARDARIALVLVLFAPGALLGASLAVFVRSAAGSKILFFIVAAILYCGTIYLMRLQTIHLFPAIVKFPVASMINFVILQYVFAIVFDRNKPSLAQLLRSVCYGFLAAVPSAVAIYRLSAIRQDFPASLIMWAYICSVFPIWFWLFSRQCDRLEFQHKS